MADLVVFKKPLSDFGDVHTDIKGLMRSGWGVKKVMFFEQYDFSFLRVER